MIEPKRAMPTLRSCADAKCERGAPIEPRTGTNELAPWVLAHARAQGRARRLAVHRRGRVRTMALARLSDRDRVADGHRLCAAAVMLGPIRAWGRRARAGAARGARRAGAFLRRRLGIAAPRIRHRKPGDLWAQHRASRARDLDPPADRRRC